MPDREMTGRENNEIGLLFRALAFAAEKHQHQRRKDIEAQPYINHPIAVASILANEGGIANPEILAGAILHDTIEDTETSRAELAELFGDRIATIVTEVTDNKSLPKAERKRLQVAHGPTLSHEAKLVKLADKISNLRDLAVSPPANWAATRKADYCDWAEQVVAGVRGQNARLDAVFDATAARLRAMLAG